MQLDDIKIFTAYHICRWITVNMSCLSIYPRCNITTQVLLPPCEDDCLEYTNICDNRIRSSVFLSNTDNPLDPKFFFNCSTPFRAFSSVASVDTDKCYNFNCELITTYIHSCLLIYGHYSLN